MSNEREDVRAVGWSGFEGQATIQFPPTVGYYCLPGLNLGLTRKPSWWHRVWVRLILGWTWRDSDER